MWYIWTLLVIFFIFTCTQMSERFQNDEEQFGYTTVIQTAPTSMKIPKKVSENWKMYAPEVKRIVYNDEQCKAFLQEHFGSAFVAKYNYMKHGAHKADLFRYAWLYINGGVYMDIKTQLIKPFKELFPDPSVCYIVVTDTKMAPIVRIYNGIIATPPKNPMMYKLLMNVMDFNNSNDYLHICEEGYRIVSSFCKHGLQHYGLNETIEVPQVCVYKETLKPVSECDNKADRYKLCTFIMDSCENIIKVRYPDYPW